VLFFVEGFTDIRFVVGLSEISSLTLCVPEVTYRESGLKERVAASGAALSVVEIPGGRPAFQLRSLAWLWTHAREHDAILSQELLRGSLNATVVGRLRGVPVLTTVAIAPVEYFRCRRVRRQIGPASAWIGEAAIRALMTVNGALSTRCLALGDYLRQLVSAYCPRTVRGYYYGIDTARFVPPGREERRALRQALRLPGDAFLVFLASRISHEKDPETVIRAVAALRADGVPAVLMNLSGGHERFAELARAIAGPDADAWVIARPAAHPILEVADYFRAADVTVQASLAEGLGLSPLESLACGTPVVATAVGGMAVHLRGIATLVAGGDARGMADGLRWVASHPEDARAQALAGRDVVAREWSREKAFSELARVIDDCVRRRPFTEAE
jgi:glycosyltransferase involved in cell wall biosynthesis